MATKAQVPDTSTTLLRDIADSQHARWAEFYARYQPMMAAYLHSHFPSVDMEDVIQETFIAIAGILPSYHYSPDERGHFRNYLTGILRNKALRYIRTAKRKASVGERMLDVGADEDGKRQLEDEEMRVWRESVYELALERFRGDKTIADRTKRIFERTAINGESPETVAAAFKMTRHAVDQIKFRAMAKLREFVKELEERYDR